MTRRLVLSYLLVSLVVLLILEIPLAIFYYQLERERFIANAERDAVILATYYQDELISGTPVGEADIEVARDYSGDTGARVVVVDESGISVADTSRDPGRNFSTRPEMEIALGGLRDAGYRDSETLETELLYVAVPIASSGSVRGALRLTIDAEEVNSRIRRFWIGLVAIALLILAALALVGLTVARSATEPIKRLRTSAARFGRGDFSPLQVDDAETPVEIQELAESMNAMGRQLEQLIERHRSFVGDASHQLRTPLTSLRLRLENLEAAAIDGTSRHDIEAAIEETIRLSNLVSDLLKLARNDGPPSLTTVDLGSLAADRVNTWQATTEQRVELLLNRPAGPVEAIAVAGAVEQVLDNLLDNALHVAPPNSRILVTVERGHMHHRLVVTDEGPGLSDDEKARATDRFWRADHHRPGTGLGLAVVASLIQASGGTLIFDDNPHGSGLRVTTGWMTLFPTNGRLTEPRSTDTIYRNTVEWSPLESELGWGMEPEETPKVRRWSLTRRQRQTESAP